MPVRRTAHTQSAYCVSIWTVEICDSCGLRRVFREIPRDHRRKQEECIHAILNQDIQTLLDGEGCIEYDEPETERKDIVTGADFEEVTDGILYYQSKRTR
jgi:hypothetical protein